MILMNSKLYSIQELEEFTIKTKTEVSLILRKKAIEVFSNKVIARKMGVDQFEDNSTKFYEKKLVD